jgi:hypothetical protein
VINPFDWVATKMTLYPSCPIQGNFPIVELPSDLPLVNEVEVNPPVFEKRARIPKPYTPAILIERRIYVLTPLVDTTTRTPFFAYYYIGSFPKGKDISDILSTNRVTYTFIISRKTYVWPYRYIMKQDLIGRAFPFKTGGFEYFLAYGQNGLSGLLVTRDYIHGRDTSPMNSFHMTNDPVKEVIDDVYLGRTTLIYQEE